MRLRYQRFVSLAAAMMLPAVIFAQDIRVAGRVVSSSGEPLPGVAVVVKGTTTGVSTDADGRFVMPTVPAKATLVFSCVGFSDVERPAGSSVDVALDEDSEILGEVMVTTQKRQQTSISVPVAVNALAGKDVALLGVKQVDDMADFIPGLQVQIQSPNNPGYVIRGVTSDDGASYSQPRISVFQDEVSISRSRASVVELFDLERVEVVKGPQGTLFGRGAEIGAIHFVRHRPTDKFGAELSVNFGTHGQVGATGYLNTPIVSGKLSNRFAFSFDRHDGYVDNKLGGSLNGKMAIALRNSTRLFAGDNCVFDLVLDYQHDDYPGTSFKSNRIAPDGGDTNFWTAAALNRGSELGIKRDLGGATLLVDATLTDALKMSSITGFRAFKADEEFDADGTFLPLLDCSEYAKGRQFSQEFRFNFDASERLNGFFGTSYFYENSSQEVGITTNMQYLYPAYAYQGFAAQAKPQFEQYAAMLPNMLPSSMEAYKPALTALMSSLMDKWFPESYDPTVPVSTTPDFYGDINSALTQTLGVSLDNIAAMLGESGTSLVSTLKAMSALPLNSSYSESSTNYGVNQAAEVFADATFNIVGGLSFSAGLRGTYEHQKTEYESPTVPDPVFGAIMYKPSDRVSASDDYWSWVGRAALQYVFGRNNAYASVSRGRRPGVIAFNNSADDISRLRPEIIVSYEAGIKGIVAKGHLAYDFSAYYYDWSHFQTTRLSESSTSAARIYVADDAGKAHSFGLEAGLKWSPIRSLVIFGNYAYIDGKFNDNDGNGQPQEYAGNRFRLTPEHSFSAGADVMFPLRNKMGIFVRPSYAYKSKVYFEDSNEPELSQDGYGIVNFVAGWQFKPSKVRFEASVYGKNILNEHFLVDAGNSGRQIGFPTFVPGAPSTFGVTLKAGF